MKITTKKILCLFFCLLFCFLFDCACFAENYSTAESGIVQNRYTDINKIDCLIDISGISATMSAELLSKHSTALQITMELQKVKSGVYETIETYTKTGTGTSLTFEKSRLINALATYRLKVTFTAGGETVVSYAYP